MAKIKEQDDFDDLNFDDLGDFDDFGGFDDMEPSVGKRNVFSRLAGGFKDGVKASFTDPKNHRTVIKEALPKGYSRIYDTTEFALESTGDLINTASKGWGDNRNQMKKAMREILPSFGENAASSKVGQRLKVWSEDVRNPHVMEDVDQEQAFMKTEVGDVFGEANGSAFEQSGSSEDKVEKQGKVSEAAQRKLMQHASQTSQILTDRIGVQLTNDMVRHLGGMHAELQRLTAYQDQVTNQYQRKSLEIKYRHYFVSRKSLDVLQQNLELSRASYDKIITNTSLPEAVKIQTNEHAQMIMREKFLGEAVAPATQSLTLIGRNIVKKSKQRIQEFFKDLGAGLGNISDGASSVLGEDSGIDPWELGGDIVGQQIGGMGMKKGASKAAKFLGRNKKLTRLGAAGAGIANNGGRIFQSLLKNDTGIKAFEWLKGTGFLDEFAYRRDETIRKDASSMLDDQAMWDQKSRKALTEVIPGLLEKANFYTSSILAFMSGKPAPEMERYNYASGLFESDKKIRNRIKKDVLGEAGNKDTAQALRNFVGEFEQKRKLSKEAKTALMNTALSESLNGGMFNMEAYARGDKRWNPDEKVNEEIQAAFMEAFYPDFKEGVDENMDGGILGDVNRTWRRGQAVGSRNKAMDAFQGISTHQGNLSKQTILNHFNVAGGNALLEMGLVTQDGNTLKMNREKLDSTIIQQALGLDVGYITSTLFELEENENSLGHSVNSHVRKMIVELDKTYSPKIEATEANFLRETFKAVQTMFFHGTNERLLNLTDLDVAEKKKGLESVAKKLSEFMSTKEFDKLSDDAQEYFKQRLDIIKTGSTAARVSAPLRDFLSPPLTIDANAWMKSKRKVLDGLKDAGLDDDILKELEKSIKNVKDATGRTVDTKLMELTGTRTYGEAAAFINRMSDKGLNWLTKSLKDPNTPPDPVLDGNSMFTKLGQTTEYMAKHSAIGRWMYTQFIKADSAINNSYENIENNQGLQREVNRLGGNRDGNEFFYDDLPQNKFRNLQAIDNPLAGHGGVLSRNPVKRRQAPSSEQVEEEAKDSIINTAAMSVVDILTMGFDKFVKHLNAQSGIQTQSWSNQGTLFNPANAPAPVAAKITGIDTDIEIHHTGGIVGEGRKWGGAGDLFGNAPRYHSGGMVKGTLDIKRDPNDLGVLIATLPNGEPVTIRSKTLTRLDARASKGHIKKAFRLAEKEVRTRYSEHFKEDTVSETLNPSVSTSPLKVDEVPAVLQKGEEVLTADDPRHRNNIREVLEGPQTPMSSATDDYLEGILENTTVANQLLQAIVEKEFKGGSESLGKITDKIKSGWTKAKTRTSKMVKGVQSRITGLFSGSGQSGLLGKARSYAGDKVSAGLTAAASGFGMFKGAALDAGSWLKDKATSGLESAQEIGEKLKAKIPSLDEIKKFGSVTVDATAVPAKEFVSGKYQATKEWWAKHHPSFKLDFSEFWTGFKEKFKNWNPTEWFKKGEGPGLGGRISAAWGSVKEMGSNILSGPANLKKWAGGKVRSGLNMLKGFMSGGAWAAMKYRNVEEITDPVSGLRQVYMGLVDLQSIIMDRMPKKKLSFFDKDGDGKRDQAGRFIGRDKADTAKVDKDGNVIPGSEEKGPGLLGSIFGTSMIGLAIKALIGGIVGETMSNLFGFDLGLVGNTLAGMATVGGGLWAAKKATGWAAGKAVDGAKSGAGALWNKVRGKENLPGTGGIVPNQPGQKGKGGAMAAAAGMLDGQGCGCCCCDDGLGDLGGGREDRRKKGKKPQRGRKAGRSGRGVRVPGGATNLAATGAQGASGVAQGAGRAGGLAGRLGGMGGRLGAVGAVVGGGLALSAISSDAEASEEEKTVAKSEVVGGMGGALAGAAAGAAVGSVVPIVGTVIGGLIGGVAGHWMGSKVGGAVGNSLAAPSGTDDVKQAQLQSIQQKSQSGEALTPEEKKTLEQTAKEEPNFLVTLLKYSPLGLAWFAAQGLTNLITGTLGIVWDGVKWVASGVGKVIGGAASLIGSAVGGVAGMIWNGAKFVAGTAAKVVGGVAGAIWDGAKWVVGTTGKAVGAVAGAVWNGVSWVGKSVAAGVGAAVGAVGKVASHVGGAVWEGTKAVGSAVGTVASAPFKAVGWVAKKAWEGAKSVGGAITGVGKGIWNGIKSVTGGAFDVLKDVGGAVLAATGIGALLSVGSKLWNFLNKDENAVTRFRFHQYGLKLQRDRDAKAVLALEKDLLENVSVGKGRSPTVKPTRPVEEYYEMFGVDPQKEDQVKNWLIWYHYRFKPIFLSHVNEWNKTMRNTKLHGGDEELGAEAAKEYLKNVHYTNPERAPYNQTANPFAGDDEPLTGVKDVNKAYEVAVKKVSHFPSKPLADMESESAGIKSKRQMKDEADDVKTSNEVAKQEQANGDKGLLSKLRDGASGLWDGVKNTASSVLNAAATVLTAPVKAVAWTAEKAWSATKAVGRGVAKVGKFLWDNSPVALAAGAVGALLGAGGKLFTYLSREKNPITRFRFAQYGLSFDKRKYSEAVLSLEADLLPTVSMVKGNNPSFEPKRPFEEYLAMFKVDPSDENEKNEWLTWFNLRFKPVFLSHVSEWNKSLRNTNIHEGDEKLGNEPAIELLKNVHYKNGERIPYNHIVNPFGDESGELPGVAEVNKAYAIAVKHAELLPKKALGDLEKSALGLDDVKRNRAEEAKEEKDVEKISEALQAKGPDELGMWDKVKAGALGLADKLNPMNFFTKQDENQMSGWDRVTNAVTTAGQEVAGTIGSWAGGGKQYASHELSLAKACIAAGMTNPKEVAMFIAQCAHETGGFKWLKELGNDSYFRKYNNRKDLGNGPNDGARFKGRGYIQLTGRYNYTRFAKASGIDVVSNPDLVSNDKNVAAKASLFWWMSNKRARAAGQSGDVVAASKAVNGGTNGLADRQKKWAYYSKAIGNDLNAWVAKLEGKETGKSTADAAGAAAPTGKGGEAKPTGAALLSHGVKNDSAATKPAQNTVSAAGANVANGTPTKESKPQGVALLSHGVNQSGAGTEASKAGDWDIDKMVQTLIKNAGTASKGQCAKYVRMAMQAGDLKKKFISGLASAYMYADALPKMGWGAIGNVKSVQAKKGDIVVFPQYGKSKHGHIAMFTGSQWISDFVQKTAFPSSNNQGLANTVFRAGSVHDSGKSFSSGLAPGADDTSTNAPEGSSSGSEALASENANSNEWSFKWKGRTDGKATHDSMDHLAKLKSMDPDAKSSTALSPTEKKAVAASENTQADQTRQGMGNWDKQVAPPVAPSIRPVASAPDSELQKIAGFGFNESTNGAALRPISVSPTTAAMAKQTNADLTAVKSAELDASIRSTQQAEADRAQAANEKAKAARIANTTNETQSEVVNLMRESLAETKQMHQTLREINRGIQKLVSSGGNALRGEEKPKANTPRRPTPPENVPVTMRVT